ncbi:MAG: hypothetical protein ACREJ2_18185 [Planctomycetota bacterium]
MESHSTKPGPRGRLLYGLLCHNSIISADGKPSYIEVFDRLNVQLQKARVPAVQSADNSAIASGSGRGTPPITLPPFHVCLLLEKEEGKHKVCVRVTDSAKHDLSPPTPEQEIQFGKNHLCRYSLQMQGLPIPFRPTGYFISFIPLLDGEEIGEVVLEVNVQELDQGGKP